MIVSSRVTTLLGETLKAVEVKLALKAGKLGLIEVVGHDMINKLLGIVYGKAASMWLPGDDMSEAIGFNLVEEGVKLEGKCD
jgi:hypothetical protein